MKSPVMSMGGCLVDTYTGVASLISVTTTVTRTVVDIAAGSPP